MDYRMMELLMSICDIYGIEVWEVYTVKNYTKRLNKELTLRRNKIQTVIAIFTYWAMNRYKIDSFRVAEFLRFPHRSNVYSYFRKGLDYSVMQRD